MRPIDNTYTFTNALSTLTSMFRSRTDPTGNDDHSTFPFWRFWLNLAWYQAIWLVAVLGGEATVPVLCLMLLLHVIWVPNRAHELCFIAICAGIGITIDSLVTLVGIMQFSENAGLLPIPLWLICVWLAFGGTLRHSMKLVMSRPSLAILLGAFFAPLTYIAGERLGAVLFTYPLPHTVFVLAMCWTCLMILFTEIWSCFQQADELAYS